MARIPLIAALGAAALTFSLNAFAEDSPRPAGGNPAKAKADDPNRPKPEGQAGGSPRPFRLGPKQKQEATKAGPEVENVYKALEALTPEQQKKFKENFIRWMNLTPDEKRLMRERDENRKRHMAEETQAAIAQSGLTLEGPQRSKFVKRYAEERRKIEEKLKKETEERRKPMVAEVINQLRTEFATPTAVAATPAAK
jgi:hypothetical protein